MTHHIRIGIDLATRKTGVVVLDYEEIISMGVIKLHPFGVDSLSRNLETIENRLKELIGDLDMFQEDYGMYPPDNIIEP